MKLFFGLIARELVQFEIMVKPVLKKKAPSPLGPRKINKEPVWIPEKVDLTPDEIVSLVRLSRPSGKGPCRGCGKQTYFTMNCLHTCLKCMPDSERSSLGLSSSGEDFSTLEE